MENQVKLHTPAQEKESRPTAYAAPESVKVDSPANLENNVDGLYLSAAIFLPLAKWKKKLKK